MSKNIRELGSLTSMILVNVVLSVFVEELSVPLTVLKRVHL